jgi:hypothetical protein
MVTGAALRLPDECAELLVGGTGLKVAKSDLMSGWLMLSKMPSMVLSNGRSLSIL